MQYFISKSNFLRITRKYDIKIDELNNEIYNKPIYFLSQVERNNILSIKQFLINSDDKFVKFKGSGYIEDSYSYVHEISHHAKYFQLGDHYFGQDERRFKKLGYLGMLWYMTVNFFNRNNLKHFEKAKVNYWN